MRGAVVSATTRSAAGYLVINRSLMYNLEMYVRPTHNVRTVIGKCSAFALYPGGIAGFYSSTKGEWRTARNV
jgi:hypothetical protein